MRFDVVAVPGLDGTNTIPSHSQEVLEEGHGPPTWADEILEGAFHVKPEDALHTLRERSVAMGLGTLLVHLPRRVRAC